MAASSQILPRMSIKLFAMAPSGLQVTRSLQNIVKSKAVHDSVQVDPKHTNTTQQQGQIDRNACKHCARVGHYLMAFVASKRIIRSTHMSFMYAACPTLTAAAWRWAAAW